MKRSPKTSRASGRRTGRLRAILAAGSVLIFAVGVTTASFVDTASVTIADDDDDGSRNGVGYDKVPEIWLSDAGNSGTIGPGPRGRVHWLAVDGSPISADLSKPLLAQVDVSPADGASYALAVTPTLENDYVPTETGVDPFPWLRFSITLPNGVELNNLSADDFNNHDDRAFNVCHANDRYPACGQKFMIRVHLDPLAPYAVSGSKARFKVIFEGMTTQIVGL